MSWMNRSGILKLNVVSQELECVDNVNEYVVQRKNKQEKFVVNY